MVNLALDINIEPSSQMIKIELYDAGDHDKSDLDMSLRTEDEELNDESKIFYSQIGHVSVEIDEVLKHYLITRKLTYQGLRPVYLQRDELNDS